MGVFLAICRGHVAILVSPSLPLHSVTPSFHLWAASADELLEGLYQEHEGFVPLGFQQRLHRNLRVVLFVYHHYECQLVWLCLVGADVTQRHKARTSGMARRGGGGGGGMT